MIVATGGTTMNNTFITSSQIQAFSDFLAQEEKSAVTMEKYLRDVRKLVLFLQERPITKENTIAYKNYLVESGYLATSINSMLASVNAFLTFLGFWDCKVKNIRTQRKAYTPVEKELTREEYLRLLDASSSNPKLNLVIQTICGTGIRVSELRYFTVENLRRGEVTVQCKNKTRTVLVPGALKKRLLKFADDQKIRTGAVFVTRSGKPLDRSNIWAQMKRLCAAANVDPGKVFPHNLRKLFARCFYAVEKDIAKLADVLGHSSIETTRIYIMTTGKEHCRQLERMRLII